MMSRINSLILLVIAMSVCGVAVDGQSNGSVSTNNPFAPSPKQREKVRAEVLDVPSIRMEPNIPSASYSSVEVVETAADGSVGTKAGDKAKSETDPTRSYNIGINDVLTISIAPNGTKANYFVSADGTIDFPLAGGKIFVAGRTAEATAQLLKENTKLFSQPAIKVEVSQHLSHRVMVTGLVTFPGEQLIVRDAVPLYVIRASAVADARAVEAVIRRITNAGSESMRVVLDKSPDFLVLPGDQVEFVGPANASIVGYYYLAGELRTAGKLELTDGLTLSNAVSEAGGASSKAKRAKLKTRDANGNTVFSEYDLKLIRAGKSKDPMIEQGNIIEIID